MLDSIRRRTTATALGVALLAGPLAAAPPAAAAVSPGSGTVAPAVSSGAVTVAPAAAAVSGSVTVAPAAVPAVPVSPDEQVAAVLAQRLAAARLTGSVSGAVLDTLTDRTVWASGGDVPFLPASTAKIATAVAVLQTYGPEHRFTTRVRLGRSPSQLVLVGSGDPGLTRAQLDALARSAAARMKARGQKRVDVWVDDTLFPAPTAAAGWPRGTTPRDVSPVRALVVGHTRSTDTSLHAGRVFAARLKAHGLPVRAVVRGKGGSTSRSTQLAAVAGPALGSQVAHMLQASDNDHAEALYRLTAIGQRQPATWAGAENAQRAVLRSLGLDLGASRLRDGSGLSRTSRVTAGQLAQLVDLAFTADRPRLAPLLTGALAVSGQTGTLATRYRRYDTAPTSCAVGLVHGKTGSLRDVATLAGWTTGADGRPKAFAFLVNGQRSTLAVRRQLDVLASSVTGCW